MEDSAIIALYWDRDQQAIQATDQKYGPVCRTIAQNILASREDAEECVNDTWHRAWETMPPKRPDSLRAYLCRIVRNLSLSRWRRGQAQKRGEAAWLLLGELEDCVPPAPSAEQAWEAAELAAALDRWLDSLPRQDRAAFLGRYWFGRRVDELAKQMGCTPNQMSQRLFRLRKSLRGALEREGVIL